MIATENIETLRVLHKKVTRLIRDSTPSDLHANEFDKRKTYTFRCNIFTCTIFHRLTRANINTCPIPGHSLSCKAGGGGQNCHEKVDIENSLLPITSPHSVKFGHATTKLFCRRSICRLSPTTFFWMGHFRQYARLQKQRLSRRFHFRKVVNYIHCLIQHAMFTNRLKLNMELLWLDRNGQWTEILSLLHFTLACYTDSRGGSRISGKEGSRGWSIFLIDWASVKMKIGPLPLCI